MFVRTYKAWLATNTLQLLVIPTSTPYSGYPTFPFLAKLRHPSPILNLKLTYLDAVATAIQLFGYELTFQQYDNLCPFPEGKL